MTKTMMTPTQITENRKHHAIAGSHFPAKGRRALAKLGVFVISARHATDPHGGETVYTVDDRDTARVWTYAQVLAVGGAPLRHAPELPAAFAARGAA